MQDYSPPVSELLTLGEPDDYRDWPDYLARGFGPQHIPDLIRMITDRELDQAEGESPLVWARLHAWRVLGQLRAVEAVEPLLAALEHDNEVGGDLGAAEIPTVFGMIGLPAVDVLVCFLADDKKDMHTRWQVATALKEIARRHPENGAACVTVLMQQLERARENSAELNAGLICELLDLKEVAAAPVMEKAFADGLVDEWIVGDWENARYELGLRPDRPEPRRHRPLGIPGLHEGERSSALSPRDRAKERAKLKRKEAKKARQRNRRK